MLSNLKIGTRLFALVVSLLVVTGIVIAFGLQALQSSNANLNAQYERQLEPIARMGEIGTALSESRSQILLALQHDPGSSFASLHDHPLSLHTKAVDKLRQDVDAAWHAVEPRLQGDTERRLAAAFHANLQKLFAEGIQPALGLLNDGRYDQANRVLLARINPLYAETDRDSDALRSHLASTAKHGYEAALADYERTRNLLLALGAAGLIFGLGFGTVLARGISGGITDVVRSIGRMAAGDFNARLEVRGKDEIAQVVASMQTLQSAVSSMVADAGMLSAAAVAGKLATRADASRHEGDFRKIVEGVNATLDAVIGPLNVAAAYVDQIARGAIPAKITDTYNGDFNTIKNNLNTAIDAVNGLVADAVMLARAAVEGRLETRADAGKHQGDYRRIVEGVNATLDAVIAPINEVKRVMVALSGGDLTQKITDDYAGDFQVLQNAVNDSMDKLAEIIEQVRGAADALTNAAGQVSATAQSLSQSSSEQAASVEETSASIEQMSASINQNSENAKITDAMASKSSAEAGEGGQAVKSTVEAMKNIAGKIGIIDDIAYQTNLLALNAAIEAARAGEHGKGFAVVAAEVRKLAERSQVAAQEIGELASGSVNLAERAGKLLDEMVPSINKTSDLVQEIASASQEQTAGVGQINNAMGQLNKATQQNASASEELAATAEELGGQAGQLQELMDFFTVDSASGARRR
jgi:methyl-accepting chemotaxis protein